MQKTKKIVAIIPARMAATRFPNKPLYKIAGIPLVEHVWRRALLSKSLTEVIVATCDQEIMDYVNSRGGKAVMTSDKHERCTDRIAEAASFIEADIVVNIQGDEPLLQPRMIDELVKPLLEDSSLVSSNLVTKIIDEEEFQSPNAPKVVVDKNWNLLYISREPIPSRKKFNTDNYLKLKQLGVIAFTSDFLQKFYRLEPTPLEMIESVDMNRAVEHGYRVRMVLTDGKMLGVDVPADVAKVEKELEKDVLFKELYQSWIR